MLKVYLSGEIHSDWRQEIKNLCNKENLEISVVDFGRGIPKDEISNLFQPFFRSDSAQDIEGTGLGLVICKRYIELQKGTLSVKSNLNKKTTFTISLPIKLNEQSFNN